MRHVATSVLFLLCVVSTGSKVYGQNKDACDLVSKADVEAILGQSLYVKSENSQSCAYSNVAPTDPKDDYEALSNTLGGQIRQEGPDTVYMVSENRAKYRIIQHCKAMNDLTPFRIAFLTPAENSAMQRAAGAAKTKADVNACISEYDAKDISANRKAAIEYCFQANDYTKASNSGVHFDACMNRYDMLQKMCRRQLELQEAYSRRKNPGQLRATQRCPGIRLSPREILAIQAVPIARTMEELPPKFFAPPNVVIPAGPQLPIPA
ncbi:MAG TPA: hypothetical protein VLL06_08760, partial [Nitrospiraceae bacterium]|nr:hypothetical protein [Nitrospiraceae bacterium]